MRFPNPLKRTKVRIRRPRIRIRWRKHSSWWAVGVAFAFFASLFALHIVLMQHAESVVRNLLDSRVREATEGFYSTAFESIEVNYTDRSLIIHNLSLYPDSSRLIDARGGQVQPSRVYDVLIPELHITGIQLKKAYLENAFQIEELKVVRPFVELYINFDLSPTAADSLHKSVNERLAPFFNTLSAGKVTIQEAALELHTIKNREKSTIKTTVDIDATELFINVALDPASEEAIQLESLLVQTDQVVGHLANQTYLLKSNGITASSTDSSFFIKDLQLLPMASVSQLLYRHPELERIYTIRIPQLYAYGIDYDALVNKARFTAGEITLLSPRLKLVDTQPKEKGEKESFKPEDLYLAIEKVLEEVQINALYIRHGQALVRNEVEHSHTKLKAYVREAAIYNFTLDSAAHYRSDKLFFADSVFFNVHDYQLRLSDNLHLLKADELTVNSNNASAVALNLQVVPDTLHTLQASSSNLYRASIPRVAIAGIDLLQLYNYNRLLIDSLLVEEPQLSYTLQTVRPKEKTSQPKEFNQQDLYGLISDYLYQLNINKLSIEGGTVSVAKKLQDSLQVFNTRIDYAQLWELQIDSASAYELQKLFYAQNFDIQIADYEHKLPDGVHAIEAKKLSVSTLQDRIVLEGVRIYNRLGYQYPFSELQDSEHSTLLNIKVPVLELNGVDILNSYLTKKLAVREVVLPHPLVHVGVRLKNAKEQQTIIRSSTLYSIIEDFTESITVDTLRLTNAEILTVFYTPNGPLQVNSTDASVAIDNFRFDAYTSRNPKRLFFADAVTVSAHEFLADLPDERYQLRADLVKASTATKSITAEDVRLEQPIQPLNEQEFLLKGKKGILSFELPEVRITGVDFDRAYYQELLRIDSIVAESPSLRFLQFAKAEKKKRKKNRAVLPEITLYESIAPFFQRLSIGKILLENGKLQSLNLKENELQQNLLLDKISISVSDFSVDSAAASNTMRFFYSDDIQVHVGEYRWNLPDKEHQITAANLDLSTNSNLIRASSVALTPVPGLADSTTTDRYFIKVPEVVLVGIPFDDIFEKEEFRLNKLELIAPDIEIRQSSSADKTKTSDRSLPERLSAGFNLLQIDEALISDGSLTYVNYGAGAPVVLSFPELEATLTNFKITPQTSASAGKPFFADNLEVRLSDWKRLLPDSLHWLAADEVVFSAKDSLLIASDVAVYPEPSLLTASPDLLVNASIPNIRLEGFNYTKLSQDSLSARQLYLLGPVVNILQNKAAAPLPATAATTAQVKSSKKQHSLKLINIDSVLVSEGVLVLRKIEAQDTSRFELNNIYVKAAGLLYDSIQKENQERILFTDNIIAGVKEYHAFLDNGFYEIEAKDVGLSTGREQLWADSLRITPALDKATFAAEKGYETDQFTVRNKRILVEGLDMQKLFNDKAIIADKVAVDGLSLYLYRDKRQPFPEDHFPVMPQERLRNSDWKILIRETEISNGYIAYAERVKGAREEGFIDLTNLHLSADTITNLPSFLDTGYVTTIHTSFDLMGTGRLDAHIKIPIGDTLNRHELYGTLQKMQLSDFNPILEKTAFISIRSGQAEEINFHIEANRERALGTMEFAYDDLRVALVNKRTGKPGGVFRRLASAVANIFVHSSNQPENGEDSIRMGEIRYQRNEHRSMVNYWVKTLIAGFKSSIGI